MSKLSEKTVYRLLLLGCILVCLAGIWIGIATNNPTHAGRGGALGVAISFFSLFALRPYGDELVETFGTRTNRILDLLNKNDPDKDVPAKRLERLNRAIELLSEKLKVDGLGQKRQNIYLALSGGISTLFWGFGDMVASWFIHCA